MSTGYPIRFHYVNVTGTGCYQSSAFPCIEILFRFLTSPSVLGFLFFDQ